MENELRQRLIGNVGMQTLRLQEASQKINFEKMERVIIRLLKLDGLVARQTCYATGMGKAGHVARKFAATMSSLGTPTHFVHPAEAAHGDLGMIDRGSFVFAFSNSGETEELKCMVRQLTKAFGGKNYYLVAITQDKQSFLTREACYPITYGKVEEVCHLGKAPTVSTLVMELIGNALAVEISRARGFTREDFGIRHHGGYLGQIAKKEESE